MLVCVNGVHSSTAHSIVQLPSSFLSIRLVNVYVVHPYSSIDTTAAWKKLRFISSDWSDFNMTDRLSKAIHTFASRILMAFLRPLVCTAIILQKICIIIHTHTNNHIYDHKQEYANKINTHRHTHTKKDSYAILK